MALRIITADERQAEERGVKAAILGKPGMGKTWLLNTTCAVTINENEDPHVVEDILRQLETLAPWKNPAYTHAGGNTAAHMKTSLIGSSAQVIVAYGNVQLGMWQGLYLCEFDGPRIRHVWVQ